jgi:hypothetical protein
MSKEIIQIWFPCRSELLYNDDIYNIFIFSGNFKHVVVCKYHLFYLKSMLVYFAKTNTKAKRVVQNVIYIFNTETD